jgi:molecular chaperone GrpE (heat shock protein)
MPEASSTEDPDFSAQMQALVIEAEQARGEKPQKNGERRSSSEPVQSSTQALLAQQLRPLLLGMESLMRSQGVQSMVLDRLEKALESHSGVPEVLTEARHSLDQRNVLNRALFDALHAELKGYKDDFLLAAVVRPVVRDLISLYDDSCELHRQFATGQADFAEKEAGSGAASVLRTLEKNLEHHTHYVLEVLERMEVRIVPPLTGKLDKRNQKVVAREAATREEDDLLVIRSVRPGFSWRDRLFRPEEVVILKWGLSSEPAIEGDTPEATPA